MDDWWSRKIDPSKQVRRTRKTNHCFSNSPSSKLCNDCHFNSLGTAEGISLKLKLRIVYL